MFEKLRHEPVLVRNIVYGIVAALSIVGVYVDTNALGFVVAGVVALLGGVEGRSRVTPTEGNRVRDFPEPPPRV